MVARFKLHFGDFSVVQTSTPPWNFHHTGVDSVLYLPRNKEI